MTKHAWSLLSISLLATASVVFGATSCAVEGVTPDCPEIPIAGSPNAEVIDEWRASAVKKGCATPLGGSNH